MQLFTPCMLCKTSKQFWCLFSRSSQSNSYLQYELRCTILRITDAAQETPICCKYNFYRNKVFTMRRIHSNSISFVRKLHHIFVSSFRIIEFYWFLLWLDHGSFLATSFNKSYNMHSFHFQYEYSYKKILNFVKV